MDVTFRSSKQLTQPQVKMPEGSKAKKMHIHTPPAKQPMLTGRTPKLNHVHADMFEQRSVKKDATKAVGMGILGALLMAAGWGMSRKVK